MTKKPNLPFFIKLTKYFQEQLKNKKIYCSCILLEIKLKSLFVKRLKSELFNLRWAYHFHLLPFKRKYKHFLNLLKKKRKQNEKANGINKENCFLQKKSHFSEPEETIFFGPAIIFSTSIIDDMYVFLLKPFLQPKYWEHFVGDPNSFVKANPGLADEAYKFFTSWNEFTKESKNADDLAVYTSIFPLEITQDYFFVKRLLLLEKTYGNKITSFIALLMLNRHFNYRGYFFENMITYSCDLQYLFRHKDSLGWFIALLMMEKKSFAKNIRINLEDIIENFSYIYDALEKKHISNKIEKPILLATGAILACVRILETPLYNATAQTNMLLLESTYKISLYQELKEIQAPPELCESVLENQDKVLNTARILHFPTFSKAIPPLSRIPEDINFQKYLAYNYSLIFPKIRKDNINNPILKDLLLGDAGQKGHFSKEVASVGITEHYETKQLVVLDKVRNNEGKLSAFEYGVVSPHTQNAEVLYVEVKPFDTQRSTFIGIKNEYETQLKKGTTNVLLVIDYTNQSNNPKILNKVKELQVQIDNNGLGGKIRLVNSSDLKTQINLDILTFSQDIIVPKLEKNKYIFEQLSRKQQNMLAGLTPMPIDEKRILSKAIEWGLLDEVEKLSKTKRK